MKAVAAVPAHTDSLPNGPSAYSAAKRVDSAGNLVPGNARILQSGPETILHQHVTVANPASFHFDPNLSFSRLWHVSFNELKIAMGLADLNSFHALHRNPLIA
jgi:hypothetical protein